MNPSPRPSYLPLSLHTPLPVQYAPEQVPYAQKRYLTESKRLLTVLDTQLAKHAYTAGADYSIADMVSTHPSHPHSTPCAPQQRDVWSQR